VSGSVTLRDGSIIDPPLLKCAQFGCTAGGTTPYTWTDSNGNRITYNWNSSTNTLSSITDTLGTTALTFSGGYPNSSIVTYTSPSGASRTVVKSLKQYTIQTAFNCNGTADYPAQIGS
jgi:hypothetical protein